MSDNAEDNRIAVQELLDAGWRISNIGGVVEYHEPRTDMTFFLHEARKLLATHKEGGTRVIAAKTGESAHGDLYTKFGAPHGRVNEMTRRNGYSCTESLSVWFLSVKDCEQFLSQAGHASKKRRAQTSAVNMGRHTHIE